MRWVRGPSFSTDETMGSPGRIFHPRPHCRAAICGCISRISKHLEMELATEIGSEELSRSRADQNFEENLPKQEDQRLETSQKKAGQNHFYIIAEKTPMEASVRSPGVERDSRKLLLGLVEQAHQKHA